MVDGLAARARLHQALGDVHRLAVVDALALSDRTPSELRALTGLPSNLLAFHLDVLEDVGLVSRHVSEADRRRRYVTLHDDALAGAAPAADPGPEVRATVGSQPLLFVCRHNAARSQLAAALWTSRTGRAARSAGAQPAARVHPHAVEVARRHGLDLTAARPRGYGDVDAVPGLVVSVCDHAREGGLPFDVPVLHWSLPDPSDGDVDGFEATYAALRHRVERLARAVAA